MAGDRGPVAVLTGKYSQADLVGAESVAPVGSRKNVAAANGALTERALGIAEVVREVARQSGATPSQVALAWAMRNPAVTAPIIGARTLAQLEDNLSALDVELTDGHLSDLEKASAIELGYPHDYLARPMTRYVMLGDVKLDFAS